MVDWISAIWVLWEIAYIAYAALWEKRALTPLEWLTAGSGVLFAFLILFAEFRTRRAADRELADERVARERDRGDFKADIARLTGYQEGAFPNIARRIGGIEDKITDPKSKAALSELRQEVEQVREPVISYEFFDERPFAWKNGEKPSYVHLWFRNEPTGVIARDAAAKLSWWDVRHTALAPLFSVDGKWYEPGRAPQAGNTTDLLPNNASHGLDLFVHKPGTDWSYGLSSANPAFDERHHLYPSIYRVKVTISCQGYSTDFYFQVATGMAISVREYISPIGEGLDVRDEVKH